MWQPIETAPKDGSAVLIAWAHQTMAFPNPTIARWSIGRKAWALENGQLASGSYHPTDWMLVPDPPKAKNRPDNGSHIDKGDM